MSEVLSKIRSLPTFTVPHRIGGVRIGKGYDVYVKREDVEKLLKADQEKLKPLMAHLQDFPTPPDKYYLCQDMTTQDYIAFLRKQQKWKEELDKRRGHPENYVSFKRKKLERVFELEDKRWKEGRMRGKPRFLKFLEELLQPSTTETEP